MMIQWLRNQWHARFSGHVTMAPPEGSNHQCPNCLTPLEALTVCRHEQRAYLHPCGHPLTFEAMSRMLNA